MNALRKMPPAMLLAFAISGLLGLLDLGYVASASDSALMHGGPEAWPDLLGGAGLATNVLLLAGALSLAARSTAGAAVGARLAAVGFAMRIAMQVAWLLFNAYLTSNIVDRMPETLWHLLQLAQSVSALVVAVGLALAARRWYLIVAGVLVTAVTHPPWFVGQVLYAKVAHSERGAYFLIDTLGLTSWVMLFLFALVASSQLGPVREVARPTRGLHRIALALRMRIGVAIVLALVPLPFVGSEHVTHDMLQAYHVLLLVAAAFTLAVLVVYALGALDAVRGGGGDLPTWPMLAASAAALWVGGALLDHLPDLYLAIAGKHEPTYGLFLLSQPVAMPRLPLQLVETGAVIGVLIALAVLARKHGLEALRQRTTVRTGIVLALALASMALAHFTIGPIDEASAMSAAIAVFGASLFIAALWLAAGTCSAAVRALAGEPALPAARVVRS